MNTYPYIVSSSSSSTGTSGTIEPLAQKPSVKGTFKLLRPVLVVGCISYVSGFPRDLAHPNPNPSSHPHWALAATRVQGQLPRSLLISLLALLRLLDHRYGRSQLLRHFKASSFKLQDPAFDAVLHEPSLKLNFQIPVYCSTTVGSCRGSLREKS